MTVELDWHVDWGVGLFRWERHDARNRVVVVVIRATHRRIERRKKWVWFSRTQCGVSDRHCAECATSSLAFNDYRHNCNTLTASTSVSSDLKALYKSVIIIIIIIIIIITASYVILNEDSTISPSLLHSTTTTSLQCQGSVDINVPSTQVWYSSV